MVGTFKFESHAFPDIPASNCRLLLLLPPILLFSSYLCKTNVSPPSSVAAPPSACQIANLLALQTSLVVSLAPLLLNRVTRFCPMHSFASYRPIPTGFQRPRIPGNSCDPTYCSDVPFIWQFESSELSIYFMFWIYF